LVLKGWRRPRFRKAGQNLEGLNLLRFNKKNSSKLAFGLRLLKELG